MRTQSRSKDLSSPRSMRLKRTTRRTGLSRLDVIVSIVIVAILLAFLLPATRSSKGNARKFECLNNIRQVGIATQNYASIDGGGLPNLVEEIPVFLSNDEQLPLSVGWPVILLPMLDETKRLKSIKKNVIRQADGPVVRAVMNPDDQVNLVVFRCPEVPLALAQSGGLSYVMNFGFIPRTLFSGDPQGTHRLGAVSWNENDDLDEKDDVNVSAATGVMWRPSSYFKPSLDYISSGDGTSNTLLITENLQAGTWYDTETTRLGFGVPIPTINGRVAFGQGQFFESGEKPLNAQFPGGDLQEKHARDWGINADPQNPKGTRPRPSSAHVGGVNVIRCDGSGWFMSEQIDPRVYIRVITSNGVTYGETPVDPNSF